MPQFFYKTRGDTDPQGKINIYFSCHPDDFDLCFSEIASDLLQRLDVAVWYCGDLETDDEYNDALEQMQLIVIPVTEKLLTRPCRVTENDLPLAKELFIPVLPVLWEELPYELYNKMFGSLQFLEKHSSDPTQIDYGKKLDDYLTKVLTDDNLAAQIRDAFDAYIFLSYRKKDRKSAQRLMNLIHETPFCRDIAIWYDEYLVPGEAFTDAIKDAMNRSSLFALAVTPNLLEQGNYVLTHEYPDALKNGMIILAAELEKTDKGQLDNLYSGLPETVDPTDAIILGEALKTIHTENINNEARHQFFIGLAYLNGIDVEVNRKRGTELISEAANSGLPEAMEQIVNMYSEGVGVDRSLESAAEWQQKLTALRSTDFEADPSAQNAVLLIEALKVYCDLLFELRRLEEAHKAALRIIKICDRFNGEHFLLFKAIAQECMGDIETEKCQTEQADDLYTSALALVFTINYEEFPGEVYSAQIRLNDKLERLAILNYEDDKAEQYLLELRRLVSEGDNSEDSLANRGVCFSRLGDTALRNGDCAKAIDYYREAEAIVMKIRNDHRTTRSRLDVCSAQNSLAYALLLQGEPQEAEKLIVQVYEECLDIDEKESCYRSKTDLAKVLETRGDIADIYGDLSGAEDYYNRSEALRRTVFETYGTQASVHSLNAALNKCGLNAMKQYKSRAAVKFYTESLALIEHVIAESDDERDLYDLGVTIERLGVAYLSLDDNANAEKYFLRYDKLTQSLIKAHPDSVDIRIMRCVSLSKLAEVYTRTGKVMKAIGLLERSTAIAEELAHNSESGDIQSFMRLAFMYYRLGELTRDAGKLNNARTIYTLLKSKYPDYAEIDAYLSAVNRAIFFLT